MEKNPQDLFKPVNINEKVFSYKDTTFGEEKEYDCSTYIEEKNILVKGERGNKNEDQRSAMIVLIDCESGGIIGGSRTPI